MLWPLKHTGTATDATHHGSGLSSAATRPCSRRSLCPNHRVQAFDEVELGRAVLIDVRPPEDHEKVCSWDGQYWKASRHGSLRRCLFASLQAATMLKLLAADPDPPYRPSAARHSCYPAHLQAHPRGAVNVPVFLVINSPSSPGEFGKWLACKVIRQQGRAGLDHGRAGTAAGGALAPQPACNKLPTSPPWQANGVTPTKPNPELAAAVAAAAAGGKSVRWVALLVPPGWSSPAEQGPLGSSHPARPASSHPASGASLLHRLLGRPALPTGESWCARWAVQPTMHSQVRLKHMLGLDMPQVILVCEAGGTIEPSINFPTGKASRSLKAAWKARSRLQGWRSSRACWCCCC